MTVTHIARRIGVLGAIALAFAIGLVYGAAKSQDTWFGQASPKSHIFVLASALILAAYAALCLGVARIARKGG